MPFPDAVLSCMFHTEKEQNPRIEWKKKGKDVSFVYFDGHFRGESAAERLRAPPQVVTWSGKGPLNKVLAAGVETEKK